MPDWPQKVANFSIFEAQNDLLGIADIVQPNLTNLTDAWKAAGTGGEIDVPIQGHFAPMSITLNWHVLTTGAWRCAVQDGLTLDCWVAHQYHNSGTNRLRHRGWRFFYSTLPKGINFGNLEVGASGAASNELEIFALRATFENEEVVNIDKEALICRIFGVDYAAPVRQLIGRTN